MGDVLRGNGVNLGNTLTQRLTDIFNQNALSSICNEDSKLRTYGLIKKSAGLEIYLTNIKSVKKSKTYNAASSVKP